MPKNNNILCVLNLSLSINWQWAAENMWECLATTLFSWMRQRKHGICACRPPILAWKILDMYFYRHFLLELFSKNKCYGNRYIANRNHRKLSSVRIIGCCDSKIPWQRMYIFMTFCFWWGVCFLCEVIIIIAFWLFSNKNWVKKVIIVYFILYMLMSWINIQLLIKIEMKFNK